MRRQGYKPPQGYACDLKAVSSQVEDDGTLLLEVVATDYEPERDAAFFADGVFEDALHEYLRTNPVVLWRGRPDQMLGIASRARMDGKGLTVLLELPRPPEGS